MSADGGTTPAGVDIAPLETARLVIRNYRPDDVDGLHARRGDPEVARYQDWMIPYPREKAERLVAASIAAAGPIADDWWQAAIVRRDTGEVVGDLAIGMSHGLRTAEVGYTLARAAWGHGYAVEAVEAAVAALFTRVGVTRVWGGLHPDNIASAMVLERSGLLFEGHTKSSFWLGDDCSDDWIYGMTRADWDEWRARPRHRPAGVELVAVDATNLGEVELLRTHRSQERFVAPVLYSLAQAAHPGTADGAPLVPWVRAVRADGELVGLVMVALGDSRGRDPFLWRLLVDRRHQRRGIGRQVLRLLYAELVRHGASGVTVSWVPGKGSPEPFYRAEGFVPTGEVRGGEVRGGEMRGGEVFARRPL